MDALSTTSFQMFMITSALLIASYAFLASQHKLPVKDPFGNLRSFLTYLLLLHSLYIIYEMTVLKPNNIFNSLGLSLGESTDTIKKIVSILQSEPNTAGTLPYSMEILLGRLGSYEMRGVYVRFGHKALTLCEYCRNTDEFAFFAFPGLLLQYLREMTLIGILTIRGTEREAWRRLAIWGIIITGMAEVYFILTYTIIVPRPHSPNAYERKEPWMIHDLGWLFRHICFLLFPIVVHSLPARQPSPLDHASVALAQTLPILQQSVHDIKHFSLLNETGNRLPTLRERRGAWWDLRRQVGSWVRHDENVKGIASGLGLGYDGVGQANGDAKEGSSPLQTNAQKAARDVVGRVFMPNT